MSADAQAYPWQAALAPANSTEQATDHPMWERLALSFEIMPPRHDADLSKLDAVIEGIAAYKPDYLAVTTSARSGWLEGTLRVIRRVLELSDMSPVAHLACTAGPPEVLQAGVRELLDLDVRGFLALRGDLPEGATHLPEDHLQYATDLLRVLRDLEERQIYRFAAGRLAVGVACYPSGHFESKNSQEDFDVLLLKQSLGADYAITQLYFDPQEYRTFIEKARQAGVKIPLIPGIMPMTSLRRAERMAELSGLRLPERVRTAMVEAGPEGEYDVGMEMTVELAKDALAAGAGGLHIYTHNNIDVTADLLNRITSTNSN